MLGGGRVEVNTKSFQNDMHTFKTKDDVLTLLIHLGYLAYDILANEVYIPNREIIEEFENAMSVGGWVEIMRILQASERLLEDTIKGNAERVALALDRAHTEAASVLTYNDENSMACAIGLAYYSARKDYVLKCYSGEILLVGVNYDREAADKPHSCVIERYVVNDTDHL